MAVPPRGLLVTIFAEIGYAELTDCRLLVVSPHQAIPVSGTPTAADAGSRIRTPPSLHAEPCRDARYHICPCRIG